MGDSNGVAVITVVVWLNDIKMYGQIYCQVSSTVSQTLDGIGLGAHAGLRGQEGQWRLNVWSIVCSAGLVLGVLSQLLATWGGVYAPVQMIGWAR